MKEKIMRDRKLLLMFFLLWIALSGWSLQYKKADLSNFPHGKLIIVWGIGIMALVSLIMSCIYVFKMYKWYNDLPPKKWTQRRVGGSINTGS